MGQRKLYIADLHFWHKNVTAEGKNFDNRPYATLDEMHKDMLERWNKSVTNADHVFVVGDMIWKYTSENRDEVLQLLKNMNGNIHLIVGNHDRINDANFKKRFEEITHYKRVTDILDEKERNVILSHYYMPLYEQHYRGSILLHGHSHNSAESDLERKITQEINRNKDFAPVEIYNVGCMYDYMNYAPKTLQDIVDGYKKCDFANLRG